MIIKYNHHSRSLAIGRHFLFYLFIFISSFTTAQNIPITGNVKSKADQQPLIGVNITIKGSATGTVSDIDGNFSFTAAPDATLVFEYTGFKSQEIAVNNQSQIVVVLSEDVEELNQIVVVGYGTMKKSDVTGSIASVAQKDISSVRSANVVEAMQGKVAGVDMSRASGRAGSNYNILLRGAKSLVASNDPLYIVDGIQYSSNVDINPNDIESMEILKDASSTAVYGARGANGVIIITTKKGSKGEPRISFNTYHGITMPNGKAPVADKDYYINFLNDVQWMKTINRNFGNIPDRDQNGYLNYLQLREKQGLEQGINNNWYDNLLKNGSQHDYNLSIGGGSDKLTYSVSLNHYLEKGLSEQDKFKRYNARFSLEAPIKKNLKVGTNSLVTYTEQVIQDNTLVIYGLQPNQNPTIPAGLTGLPNTPGNNPFGDARQLSPLLTGYNDNDGLLTDATKEGDNANLIYYPNQPTTINTNPFKVSRD